MKNLDLNDYCVQEMNAEEMCYVDGGSEYLNNYTLYKWEIERNAQATIVGFFVGLIATIAHN